MQESVLTEKSPSPFGPYSQAIVVNGFVFCSGQIGIDPKTRTLGKDLETQTNQTMKNLEAILKEAGSDLKHVVKTTIFLLDPADFVKVNEIYGKYFGNNKPARSTVVVKFAKVGLPTMPLIEIECIAYQKKK